MHTEPSERPTPDRLERVLAELRKQPKEAQRRGDDVARQVFEEYASMDDGDHYFRLALSEDETRLFNFELQLWVAQEVSAAEQDAVEREREEAADDAERTDRR